MLVFYVIIYQPFNPIQNFQDHSIFIFFKEDKNYQLVNVFDIWKYIHSHMLRFMTLSSFIVTFLEKVKTATNTCIQP